MRRLTLLLSLIALAGVRLRAQSMKPIDDTDLCLGFAFGTWRPALDWAAAGHRANVDTTIYPKAPGGRDWAVSGTKSEGDTTFVLFPMWWPAGVAVSLEHMPRSPSDTVRGSASALVADGRKTPPTSVIRAWQKPCHG